MKWPILMGQAREVRSVGWILRGWMVELKCPIYKGNLNKLHSSLSEAIKRLFRPCSRMEY